MKTLIVLAHPDFGNSKVNKALIESLPKDTENLTVHNLYEKYPDAKIDVAAEQKRFEQHDRIIFQFPLYWYSCPSLLKKMFDDVFLYGWCYGSTGKKLHGKEFGIVVSTGGPERSYQAGGFNCYTLSELLRPFQATANLVGATYLPIHAIYGALSWSKEEFGEDIKKYLKYLSEPKQSKLEF